MPKYFFHVTHKTLSLDLDGETLPDAHSAWQLATRTSGEIMRDLVLGAGQEWRMDVADEDGQMLFAIRVLAEFYTI